MKPRLLVISEDPVGGEMGGNAIRAYEIARAMSPHAEVTLAAPQSPGAAAEIQQVPFDREDPRALRAQLAGIDVVVTLPQNPVVAAVLQRSEARVVYDLYDPKALQALEAFATGSRAVQRYRATLAHDHVMGALSTGDYLICAGERQRDLWIGAMLAAGLLRPELYRTDPSLRSLIDVVPFGVPDDPPMATGGGPHERFPALGRATEIVLWNGGLWNWLDPVGAVDAIARVVERRPDARLLFMGRPPLGASEATAAIAARTRAEELGLLDEVVFFNDSWIPYDHRADWLLGADCALTMHLDHLETRYAFRTRLLDCFWAGLPVVCTTGDELAERVERDGLGATIPPRDPQRAADAIMRVLENGRARYAEALSRASADYRWPAATAPLLRYLQGVEQPRLRRRAAWSPGRSTRAVTTRAVRRLLRFARRLS